MAKKHPVERASEALIALVSVVMFVGLWALVAWTWWAEPGANLPADWKPDDQATRPESDIDTIARLRAERAIRDAEQQRIRDYIEVKSYAKQLELQQRGR